MATNLARRHTQLNYGSGKEFSTPIDEAQPGQKRALSLSDEGSDQAAKIKRPNSGRQDSSVPVPTYKSSTPWASLDRLFTQNAMTVCRGKMYAQQQVAIKERKCHAQELNRIIVKSHEHLVRLFDIFFEDEIVDLVYEYMDVSLRNIASLPERLSSPEIAMVCKAICSGLSYIHDELQIAFGNLDGSKVLVNRSGNVKIASIGDELLDNRSATDISADVRSVGLIMVELMEHTTSALHPNEHKIRNPEHWEKNDNILTFLADTQTSLLAELLAHDFMPKAPPDYGRLSHWVILTQMNAYIKNQCIIPDGKAIT